ncbi:MAG: hypothetical protein WBG71_12600 [Leeuwenhoekiella sp.]
MKGNVIVVKWWRGKRFAGVSIWPFIFVKHDKLTQQKRFINHERIHLRQQLELGILPFYLWYLLEYAIRLIQYQNFHLAYRNICFEREAYKNDRHLEYLKTRKTWAFFKYL